MPRLSCVTHAIHPRYRVIAPARLHLGFVDLQGGMGRRFGSLGLAINGLDAVVEAGLAPQPAASGEGASRVAALIESLVNEANAETGIELTVHSLPPAHAGLGSGTLLALTAGTACATALGLSSQRMPSGAGHDAMKLHDLMPQAMLFVRGENSGISHNPLESTNSHDIDLTVRAFQDLLGQLSAG
jgi:acetylornithine deacetylase/succinyl-diaminopimelate desuccinylase-like protein